MIDAQEREARQEEEEDEEGPIAVIDAQEREARQEEEDEEGPIAVIDAQAVSSDKTDLLSIFILSFYYIFTSIHKFIYIVFKLSDIHQI